MTIELPESIKQNKKLSAMVKKIESYVEITGDMLDVEKAIYALKACSSDDRRTVVADGNCDPENQSLDYLTSLSKMYNESKNSWQEMRDDLWKIRDKLGTYQTLILINSNLGLSLEVVFAGAILTYTKAFNSSNGRTKLKDSNIFDKKEYLDFHMKLVDLRDKHFAHSEYVYNRHILSCIISNDGGLKFNTDTYKSTEFWIQTDYLLFYKLVSKVKKYLECEINNMSANIRNSLSKDEIEKLRKKSHLT